MAKSLIVTMRQRAAFMKLCEGISMLPEQSPVHYPFLRLCQGLAGPWYARHEREAVKAMF